jgi:hypothetical protein
MIGVGNVLKSHWQAQSEGQQPGVARGPMLPRSDSAPSPAPISAPSDCTLVSPIPHYTAHIGEAISLIQSTLRWIDKASQCLEEVSCAANMQNHDRPPNYSAELEVSTRRFIDSLEQVVQCMNSCQTHIVPEFRIGFSEPSQEKESHGILQLALAAWQDVHATGQTDANRSVVQNRSTLQAYHRQVETWLQQLTEIASHCLTQEEAALGIDLSFVSRVNAHQLERELSAWLSEVALFLDQVHHAVLPSRAAVLLHDSPSS